MKRLIPRVRSFILLPVLRLVGRLFPLGDPWERFPYNVPLLAYGAGNRHDFSWYLEGESRVQVTTIAELQEWLLGCHYVRDAELFHKSDVWQHPAAFERLRQGDCEDHALWAWRKLGDLGFDAELVSGRLLLTSAAASRSGSHVWVLLRQDGETFLFEATSKSRDRMLRRLDEVRAEYLPAVGVDRQRRRFAYNGLLVDLRTRPHEPSFRTAL